MVLSFFVIKYFVFVKMSKYYTFRLKYRKTYGYIIDYTVEKCMR